MLGGSKCRWLGSTAVLRRKRSPRCDLKNHRGSQVKVSGKGKMGKCGEMWEIRAQIRNGK